MGEEGRRGEEGEGRVMLSIWMCSGINMGLWFFKTDAASDERGWGDRWVGVGRTREREILSCDCCILPEGQRSKAVIMPESAPTLV